MKLNFIPVTMRLPLKFGAETIHSIQIAHVEFEAYGAVSAVSSLKTGLLRHRTP